MLIYEKREDGSRKLMGTMDSAPSADDQELEVTPEFDFNGSYFYKAPGGIQTDDGTDVIVSIDGEQIIPPTWSDAGEVNEDYDESEELINDNDTPDDDSDDTLIKVWTEEELEAETKATIAQMASVLGYEGIDTSMTKSAMIEAFLSEQTADPRNK